MTEWDATGYARVATLQEAMADEALAGLRGRGRREGVLDLGCGDGKITAKIATLFSTAKVVGVDASAEMIALASQTFPREQYPNLRFQVADIRYLRFSDEFYLVVSFNALHWIPDQYSALRAIYFALKPEGIAYLRLVPDGERKSLETVIEEARQSSRWAGCFQDFRDPYLHVTPEQYAALAEENGFRVVETHTADKAWNFGSRAKFEAFAMVTFVEWTKRLPEDKRLAFVRDVLNRYREVSGEESIFRFYQMGVALKRA